MGMSIRQYAKSRSIAYESARRQVRRYSKELAGHTTQENGCTMLDDTAITFLDGHRRPKAVIVEPNSKETAEEIENLRAQVSDLQSKLIETQDQLIKSQREVLETQTQYAALLEQKDTELNSFTKTWFGLYRKT